MEDYKQKYETAINQAKEELKACGDLNCDAARQIFRFFPELKESDERIRKEILEYFHQFENEELRRINISDWIAWLKKQGEKNLSTDFSDLRTWKHIVDAVWTEKEGIGQYLDSPLTEETAKKLQKRFGNIEQKPAFCHHEVDFSGCSEEYRKAYYDGWNNCNQQHDQLEAEQKPAWSEEDNIEISVLINALGELETYGGDFSKQKNWLKTIKDRVQPQPKQE